MNHTRSGRKGEAEAADYLERKGIRIIARNVRSPRGEVDLVGLEGDTLVFIEVKSWSAFGIGELGASVNERKQRRIIETAKYFLSLHREYNSNAVRFDIVFIGPDRITHLASAFMERV